MILAIAAAYAILAIPSPAGAPSTARAISASGVVAGRMGEGAFTWDGKTLVRYKPVEFDAMETGPFSSIANAIDARGVAAGSDGSYYPQGMSGILWSNATTFVDGATRFFDKFGAGSFEAYGIDDRGDVVGVDGYRGFVRLHDGRMISVSPLSTRDEWNGTRASAIDNEGHVVGGTTIDVSWYGRRPLTLQDEEAMPIHAFLATRDGGGLRLKDLGALDGIQDTYATAINEDLTVVGYSGTTSDPKHTRVSGNGHAWVWQRGRMTDLGTLHAGESSYAFGVNDASLIVGCSGTAFDEIAGAPFESKALHAAIWVNKIAVDLNDLIPSDSGWTLVCARAINRAGWIAGDGIYQGRQRAFLLSPRLGVTRGPQGPRNPPGITAL